MLSDLHSVLQDGTVESLRGDDFTAYVQHASELSISHGCIASGDRVVFSVAARAQTIALVHTGHRSVVVMKNCSRGYLW